MSVVPRLVRFVLQIYIYICREGGRFGQMDFLFQIIDAYPFASSSCTCA